MKRACIQLKTNTYEQNHASSIRPIKINLVRMKNLILIMLSFLIISCGNRNDNLIYKNPQAKIEDRVEDLIKRMNLEEKVAQLTTSITLKDSSDVPIEGLGCLTEVFNGLSPREAAIKYNELQKAFIEKTRLGIPVLYHGEAVFGLMANGCMIFPQPIAQAATFDPEMQFNMAKMIAAETKSWGHHQVLSPTINVAYDSRWGRTHETYGEDPYLVSCMGLAYIQAMESSGIITTPKHFAANIGHNGSFGGPVFFNERFLREVELPPFKVAVKEGHCSSIMPAYNSINGIPCVADSWLLNDVLRKEWGFKGFVGSDYGAVAQIVDKHKTAKDDTDAAIQAINAGTDVEMPRNQAYKNLVQAVKDGKISEKTIDHSLRRFLYQKFKSGVFDKPFVNPDSAEIICNNEKHRSMARKVSQKSIVLLKNENNILPFSKNIKKVSVLGPLADKALMGNYSGWGIKTYSVLEGLINKYGNSISFTFEKGVELTQLALPTIAEEFLCHYQNGNKKIGLEAEYFNNINLEGRPEVNKIDAQVNFEWGEGVPHPFINNNNFSVRWTGKLISPASGKYKIGLTIDDGARLFINNVAVIDEWRSGSIRLVEAFYNFEKGKEYDLRIEYFEGTFIAACRLGWNAAPNANIPKALELAKNSDACIIVCGAMDGEGSDRAELNLSASQEELILAIAKTGKPFVVVLNTGNVITTNNWADQCPAILEAWYMGAEGGNALAEIIFGDVNPSGKLPITFPKVTGQVPCYYHQYSSGAGSSYISIGNEPQFPFGHGLSYTQFAYENLNISDSVIKVTDTLSIRFDIKNIGNIDGDEVCQLYFEYGPVGISRPSKLLKRFKRIALKKGEKTNIQFTLSGEDFYYYDKQLKWVPEINTFNILVGSSSKDIRLIGSFSIR